MINITKLFFFQILNTMFIEMRNNHINFLSKVLNPQLQRKIYIYKINKKTSKQKKYTQKKKSA